MKPIGIDGFWDRINKTESCWLWTGKLSSHGYGNFEIKNKFSKAHRGSWYIHFGEIPEGMYVLHKCDIRACVNPDHLFLGTSADNNKDRASKGRTAKPVWCIPKLNDDQNNELITKYLSGISQRKLAAEYNVDQRLIWKIIHNNIEHKNTKHSPKLTVEQRLEIKRRFLNGERQYLLAKEYGIHQSSIPYILKNY